MEMRKFIIEMHPDGTLTSCEYEDPKEYFRAATERAWLAGYRQALKHCDEQVNTLKSFKGTCQSSDLMYQGPNPFAMWCHRPIVNTLTQKNKSKRPLGRLPGPPARY